jgi:hypothetical protein
MNSTRVTSKYIGMRLKKEQVCLLQDDMNGTPQHGIIWGEDATRFMIETWVLHTPIEALKEHLKILTPTMLLVSKDRVYPLVETAST